MSTAGEAFLWVRVGDAGEYEVFYSLDEALEYLNDLWVGKVENWHEYGFETANFYGQDYISIFWGGADANPWADLDNDEREIVENGLEENYL